MNLMKDSIVKKIYFTLGILLIFIIWVIGEATIKNDYIVPSISSTMKALGELLIDTHTYKVLGHTLLRLVISISVCFLLGVVLAVLSYNFYRVRWLLKPIISLFKTLPIVVVIILLFVMLDRELSPYYIVGVVVLPVVYEAILIGLDNINTDILDDVKISSNTTPYVLTKVHLPIIFPSILTAIIQSIGLGFKVLVMGEYITQPKYSIGNEFVHYKEVAAEMEYLYAWSMIIIIIVLGLEVLISYISRKKDLVL